MKKIKNTIDALKIIHSFDSLAIKKQQEENARLKDEVERLTRKLEVSDNHAQCLEMVINAGTANELRLKAEVERLRKAVMHSPAAQLKLKELEGKTTYEEINPKENENNS